jgi:hypothetical protein
MVSYLGYRRIYFPSTKLRERYADATVVRIWGNVFGTSGHVEHAARRKEGDALQALMTENYLFRAELDRTAPHINGVP